VVEWKPDYFASTIVCRHEKDIKVILISQNNSACHLDEVLKDIEITYVLDSSFCKHLKG
jgi:hypothetical protein